jgi:hypothetical protein
MQKLLAGGISLVCLASLAVAAVDGYSNDFSTLDGLTASAPLEAPYQSFGGTAASVDVPAGTWGYLNTHLFDQPVPPGGAPFAPINIDGGEITLTWRFDYTGTNTPPTGDVLGLWLRVYSGTFDGTAWAFQARTDYFFSCEVDNGWATATIPVNNPGGHYQGIPIDPTQVFKFRFDVVFWDANKYAPATISLDEFTVTAAEGERPVADAGADQTVPCTSVGGVVTVDGSGSYDPDGDAIVRYVWTRGTTTVEDSPSPVALLSGLPCNTTSTLSLKVYDERGRTSELDTIDVTVAGDWTPPAIDNVVGPFGIKAGDIYGTSQHPYVLPSGDLGLQVINQRTGLPDPTGDRQFVFDEAGNLYYLTWNGMVKSLSPSLGERWTTPDLIGTTGENAQIVVGERYVYVCGAEQGSGIGKVYALSKATGEFAPTWPNTGIGGMDLIDGGYVETWMDNANGRALMTLWQDKLYVVAPVQPTTPDGNDPARIYQVDASTGLIDWVSTVFIGGVNSRAGHALFVPDLYGTGQHGLFFGNASEGEADGLSDTNAVLVNPASGATLVWGVDAGAATDYTRMIYSNAGGRDAIYGITLWNWAGKQFWSYDKNAGLIEGVRGGDFAPGHRGEAAALSQDGLSVYAGGDNGRLYKYTPDATGANTQVGVYQFQTDEYDARALAPRVISMTTADGREILVTTRSEWRWWDVDPNDPANDRRDISTIALLDVTNAPSGNTEEELDDGPIYIDDVVLSVNGTPVFTDNFESYPLGPVVAPGVGPWAYVTYAPGNVDDWTAAIVSIDGRKCLKLDPFGGNGNNVTSLMATLASEVGGAGQVVEMTWMQKRSDLCDNVYIGDFDGSHGVYQWDGAGDPAAQKAYGVGGDPGWEPSAAMAPGVWQAVAVTVDYDTDYLDLMVDGTNDGQLPFLADLGAGIGSVELYMWATPVTCNEIEFQPEIPAAELAMSQIINPVTFESDWGYPDALSVAPNGDIYVMQFKGYERRYTRVRVTGDTGPTFVCGDTNCDGAVDTADIDNFVFVVVNGAAAPGCPTSVQAADTNGDGVVDTADIDSFVAAVINGGCQ